MSITKELSSIPSRYTPSSRPQFRDRPALSELSRLSVARGRNFPRLLPLHAARDAEGMLTFTITAEDRRRAQARAAELDICLTHPSGKYPHVWDNRQNSVKRWYDYESGEN